jgi:uncharacterized protein
MIHPDTELRFISDDVGYGVFATQPISRGTLVWTLCHFDRIYTPNEVGHLPLAYRRLIDRFAYINPDADYVLCWDAGRYVNHSCNPAMLPVGRDYEILVRDIIPGEQITCDYAGCNLSATLTCRCGAPNCRGTIGGADMLTLCEGLDQTVAAALRMALHVPQPLLAFARDGTMFIDYASGRRPMPSQREHYVDAQGRQALQDRGHVPPTMTAQPTEHFA